MSGKRKKDTIVQDIARMDFVLQETMEDAGMEAETYGIWGVIWKLFYRHGERTRHPVRKKPYILLTILTGWMGGHRFYARRCYLGAIYLMFCWTLIPFMMSVLDLMEAVPMKSDEHGYIMM